MIDDFIKKHWEMQAEEFKGSFKASWEDKFAIELEIETIGKYISDGDIVLDVGCANGYSALKQLESKQIKSLVGIDYSEKMITQANRNKDMNSFANIKFEWGDVRSINCPDNEFDVVYTTRVLINLPNWEEQIQAIDECMRVTKPGGKFVLSEAFWEPLTLLNSLRALKQLPPLIEHDFNRYLKKSKLEKYLDNKGYKYIVNDFSSIYYLGSRFLRELIDNVSDYQNYENEFNYQFYLLEKMFTGGGMGIQQAYIIEK